MLRVSRIAVVLVMSLLLASCGSRGVVSTKDDSVDYKTARRLPPLKKPSKVLIPETSPSAASDVAVVTQPALNDAVDTATPLSESRIGSLPADSVTVDSSATDSSATDSSATGSSTADAPNTDLVSSSSTPSVSTTANSVNEISTEISNLKNNTARLKVAGDYDVAWEYLVNKLGRSSVTVFSRNKAAGRFAIGCAAFQMPESEDSEAGGWAIFNRSRAVSDDYCTLSVSESRGNIVVSALDRDGDEVGKVGATLVFEQLLND